MTLAVKSCVFLGRIGCIERNHAAERKPVYQGKQEHSEHKKKNLEQCVVAEKQNCRRRCTLTHFIDGVVGVIGKSDIDSQNFSGEQVFHDKKADCVKCACQFRGKKSIDCVSAD